MSPRKAICKASVVVTCPGCSDTRPVDLDQIVRCPNCEAEYRVSVTVLKPPKSKK